MGVSTFAMIYTSLDGADDGPDTGRPDVPIVRNVSRKARRFAADATRFVRTSGVGKLPTQIAEPHGEPVVLQGIVKLMRQGAREFRITLTPDASTARYLLERKKRKRRGCL